MKKLKLNLDELKVDSFEITEEKNSKGTINGNTSLWCPPTLLGITCDENNKSTCCPTRPEQIVCM